MDITFYSFRFEHIIASIAEAFGVDFETDCGEYYVEVPKSLGEGYIRGINFQHGLGLLHHEAKYNEEVRFIYGSGGGHPLHIIFCSQGKVSQSDSGDLNNFVLDPLQSCISVTEDGLPYSLIIAPGKKTVFNSLEIIRRAYLPKIECDLDTVPQRLADIFKDITAKKSFLYLGDYSLALAGTIQELNNCYLKGLLRKTYSESKALEIFSLMLSQYEDDMLATGRRVLLRRSDVEQIKQAQVELRSNLCNPPTIPELARSVGINESKLQKGFKTVTGTTINKYLRNERLEKAKVLLESTDMNVSEVATQVGYANKSHFANRFQEKFGHLPKQFSKRKSTDLDNF